MVERVVAGVLEPESDTEVEVELDDPPDRRVALPILRCCEMDGDEVLKRCKGTFVLYTEAKAAVAVVVVLVGWVVRVPIAKGKGCR